MAEAAGAPDAEGEGADEAALDDGVTLGEDGACEPELQAQASRANTAPNPGPASTRALRRRNAT